MPHCIIEHSDNFDTQVKQLMDSVYEGAAASGLFNSSDIKTRTLSFSHYQVGNKTSPFIHVSAKILSGRTDQQKNTLSTEILNKLIALNLPEHILTIEVIDIHRASHTSNQ